MSPAELARGRVAVRSSFEQPGMLKGKATWRAAEGVALFRAHGRASLRPRTRQLETRLSRRESCARERGGWFRLLGDWPDDRT